MKHALPALSLSLMLAAPAAAQGPGDPVALLERADTDHDGRVSLAEFQAARLASFDRLDRNGDGVISRADFSRILAFRPQASTRIDTFIAEADLNHDGKVTREELAHAPARVFAMADANRDGFVDKAEMAAARDRLHALQGGQGG